MASPIRRVVTGKDATGKAIAIIDAVATTVHRREELGVTNTLLWVTDSTPADLSNSRRRGKSEGSASLPPPGGTIFRVIEFAPEREVKADYADPAPNLSRPRPCSGRRIPRETAPPRNAPDKDHRLCFDFVRRDRHAPGRFRDSLEGGRCGHTTRHQSRLGQSRENALPGRRHPCRRKGLSGCGPSLWISSFSLCPLCSAFQASTQRTQRNAKNTEKLRPLVNVKRPL